MNNSNCRQQHEYSELMLNNARKRVAAIKSWYWSIPMFVVGTLIILALVLLMQQGDTPNFIIYIMAIGPIFWWVLLIVKGFNLFLPKTAFMKKLEAPQIKKYLYQD